MVTNLDTGKAEYFPVERRDDRFEALQPPCALPFLFPVFDIQGKPCMDGGAADAIPYERALERGCERGNRGADPGAELRPAAGKLQPLDRRGLPEEVPRFCDTMRRRAGHLNA